MTTFGFLLRNTLRSKRRLFLSVSSVAFSLFLLVTLLIVLREFSKPPIGADSSLRVAVQNKIALTSSLPFSQRDFIKNLPGVAAVSPFSWFGGKVDENEQMMAPSIAVEAQTVREVFTEMKIEPAVYEAWLANKTGCIVGVDSMKSEFFQTRGYKVGSKITLISGFYPCKVELTIVGTYNGTIDDKSLFFHHKYFEDEMTAANGKEYGKTGMWWLRLTSPEALDSVTRAIEGKFANTSSEVRAESERAFQMGFFSMVAGIKTVIGGVSIAVLLSILFVTATNMSMSIRERFRELAVLKAVGFQRRELCAFIMAESFALSALGAFIGAGGAKLLYTVVDMRQVTKGFFVSFELTSQMLGIAAAAAAILGLVSAIFPAVAVARMSVVQGLKTLD